MTKTRAITVGALGVGIVSAALFVALSPRHGVAEGPTMTVYKSPTCGCCAKWVDHAKASGFRVEVHDLPSVAGVKAKLGVPANMTACHTAVVDGLVVEGHIPADLIYRALADRGDMLGIAVPGMPVGLPGMEGQRTGFYQVFSFTRDGATAPYALG